MKDNRIAWIDNTKLVAMLFVMLGHTWRIIHCPLPVWLDAFILSFNMSLFVILSGYTSVNSLSRITSFDSLIGYVDKITKRMLVPSLVFGLVLMSVLRFTDGQFHPLALGFMLLGCAYCVTFSRRNTPIYGRIFRVMCWLSIPLSMKFSPFWFFNMLWCVCAVSAVGVYIAKQLGNFRHPVLMGGVISLLLSLVFNFMHDKTSDFIIFYLLGQVLYAKNYIDKMASWAFIPIFFIIGIISLVSGGIENMNFWDFHPVWYVKQGKVMMLGLRVLCSLSFDLSVILLVKKLSSTHSSFSQWGTETLSMYMIHAWIINLFYGLPFTYELKDFWYMFYAIPTTVALFYATIELIKLSRRYPLTRAFVLGERF